MTYYYSNCSKCGFLSYLSVGREYICTNPDCKFKESEKGNSKILEVENNG